MDNENVDVLALFDELRDTYAYIPEFRKAGLPEDPQERAQAEKAIKAGLTKAVMNFMLT